MDEITLFATIAPPPPADAEEIRQVARARLAAAVSGPPRPARARRGPLVLAGAAVAAVAVAAGALLTVGQTSAGHPAATVHVNLAAWSVNTNLDGTVTVKTRDVSDPGRLQRVLAEAGIPALVRWGELCRAPQSQYLPTRGIVDGPDYVGGIAPPVWIGGRPYANDVWTFTPSKMPPGARYMITAVPPNRVPRNRGDWTWGLIRDGAHLTCRSPGAPGQG
jgi:hypothetical protein